MERPKDKSSELPQRRDEQARERLHQLITRLRYKHLRLLLTLAECGNLHRTAERMAMSQPAATRMLAEIENAFDCRLFERHPRG
ncbi:helix-turn-helix domain-containing protein [Kushneria sinocarnis]|uniref:helix-turn-helix domain-containing protein n=1 Tax=Kushneria sinocarnis TaxID=595502 RepID=UPI001B86A981|nr:LysR family transcriptional regulator [Kushneria sinocarnis]